MPGVIFEKEYEEDDIFINFNSISICVSVKCKQHP